MIRMKRYAGALAATLLVAAPAMVADVPGHVVGSSPVQAQQARVSISFFFDALEPHGTWVHHDRYRFVWVPAGVPPGWRPYTHGHWVYTERYGWLFVSDEPFAWAVYHYGRWAYDPLIGWFWVPGTIWGPAWVIWRRGPEYVGWAPLPPQGDGFAVSLQITVTDAPEDHFVFVPVRRFLEPRLSVAIILADERPAIFRRTELLGPVVIQNNIVVNNFIDIDVIEKETKQKVVVHNIEAVDEPSRAEASAEDRSVRVFQPQVEEGDQKAEPEQAVEPEELEVQRQDGERRRRPLPEGQAQPPEGEAQPQEGEAQPQEGEAQPQEGEQQQPETRPQPPANRPQQLQPQPPEGLPQPPEGQPPEGPPQPPEGQPPEPQPQPQAPEGLPQPLQQQPPGGPPQLPEGQPPQLQPQPAEGKPLPPEGQPQQLPPQPPEGKPQAPEGLPQPPKGKPLPPEECGPEERAAGRC